MNTLGRIAISLLLFSISPAGVAEDAPKRLKVLTTILPLYCFTAGVAGDLADVDNLIPASASGHDYQLSIPDARKLNNADLMVITGLGLESFLKGKWKAVTVKAATGIDPIRGHVHEDHRHGDEANPHFWLDPTLAAHAVTNIARALQSADPSNAARYASNAAAYVQRLHALDEEIKSTLAPYRGRAIVTYHDAFPYFTRHYGLEVAGTIQEVADVDPTPRHLKELRTIIREKKVGVIFTEAGGENRYARDLGAKLAVLDPLESGDLAPDAYERGMRQNLAELKKAFHAPVP
jgi:zinc transport system substrate-binding protein